MIRIIHQRFWDFDARTRKTLRRATFREGYMRPFSVAFPDSPVIAVFGKRHLLGWVLILSHGHGNDPLVSTFVNIRYRKRGIGTFLITETIRRYRRIRLGAWDKETTRLFYRLQDTYPKHITVFDWPDYAHIYRDLLEEAQSYPPIF